jgi:5-methylcytosine-specific restriction endonuclease McrA
MAYNARKKKNIRSMSTTSAIHRLFGNRKRRPCAYCGTRLTAAEATFDHVKALSQGGYDKTRNGAIACHQCNRRKGAMSREAFLKTLQAQEASGVDAGAAGAQQTGTAK